MPNNMPVSNIDVWSDENLIDPFPMYKILRDMGPVTYLERHDCYAVTRFKDVKHVLSDWESFSSAAGVSFNDDINPTIAGSLIGSDPPIHQGYRSILERPLVAAEMRAVRDRIKTLAADLVSSLAQHKEIEAVSQLASYLPVTLVSELVGLPQEGRERMLDWASGAFNALAPTGVDRVAEGMQQMAGMGSYFEDPTLPDRLRPGSWGARLDAAVHAGELTREEFCRLLQVNYILPALDTTIHATGNMIWLLASHPDIWERLRANSALVGRVVNEALRLEGPVQAFSRVTTQDVVIDGTPIPAGKRLFVSYASANRDERHYSDPDTFNIDRNASDHLSFGYDEHLCLGRNLATLEMTMLLTELVDKVDKLTLISADRHLHNTLRGFARLNISLR